MSAAVAGGLFSLIAVALTAAVAAVFLRDTRLPAMAVLLMLAAGALIFLRLLPSLRQLWQAFAAIGDASGVNTAYVALLLKIIGVAYLAEFAAQVCRDAGQGAAALKIEFAAKVAVLLLALPVLQAVVAVILALLD